METNNNDTRQELETEVQKERRSKWKQLCAYVYLTICLFDFMVMPLVVEWQHEYVRSTIIHAVEQSTRSDEVVIKTIEKVSLDDWHSLTLTFGGLFHITFGAILTGITITGFKGTRASDIK